MSRGPLTIDQIRDMDEQTINNRWAEVSEALAANRHAEVEPDEDAPDDDTDVTTPVKSGVQMHSNESGPAPLTMADAKRMSVAEYERRRDEIDDLARRGGGRAA